MEAQGTRYMVIDVDVIRGTVHGSQLGLCRRNYIVVMVYAVRLCMSRRQHVTVLRIQTCFARPPDRPDWSDLWHDEQDGTEIVIDHDKRYHI